MALNLSTLTSPATSGNVLQEVTTTADFLESVPVLRNLARGTNAGGDAEQSVALNQPKALPLIDGEGYLYVSGIAGNSATVPHESSLNLTNELEVVARVKYRSYSGADAQCIVAKWAYGDFNFRFHTSGYLEVFFKDSANVSRSTSSAYTVYNNNVSDGDTIWVKMTIDASSTSTNIDFYTSKDSVKNEGDVTWTALGTTRTITTNGGITSGTNPVSFGAFDNSGNINDDLVTGAILKANYKSAIGGSPVLDVDFTANNVRHGDTKFKCATGQVVTINQSGNDPATVIKKPVLRFDGVNSVLRGLLGHTHSEGYLFAAFTGLSTGGDRWGRVFTTNPEGLTDNAHGIQYIAHAANTSDIGVEQGIGTAYHLGLWDKEKNVLVDLKVTNGLQRSRVNNADEQASTNSLNVSTDQFNIGANEGTETRNDGENAPLDLEYLALFPATITDAQADQIRNYINNRNRVFSLIDSQGYFFFDGAATDDGQVLSSSTPWNGRIVGSDNGDSDFYISQNTLDDRPTTDGYKITFADNTDHFDIPSTTQAGWQVVGTSKGTFAYRVNANAVSELTMLGNAGTYRASGDLYGIILLPESATNRDIEEARKLLIDRGALDAAYTGGFGSAWLNRTDIVEFRQTAFQGATTLFRGWKGNSNLVSFSAIQATNCSNFQDAWYGCSSLTQFPQDAKLGTEASNVNFTSAWQSSGLTSFPALDLSSGIIFVASWNNTNISKFPLLNLNNGRDFELAWRNNNLLTDFPSGFFDSWNPITIYSGVFNETWDGCPALTATSVENILTSIAASGKWSTQSGLEGGTALSDATIDIDYNVATGSLTAATLSAIETLNGRGWSVNINGVIQ